MITDEIPYPPATWTPDWVMYLMVLSSGIFGRLRERVGPGGYKVAWPSVMYDEEVDPDEALTPFEKLRSASEAAVYVRPDPDEVDLAVIVSRWPSQFLLHSGNTSAIARWAEKRSQGHAGNLGIMIVEAEAKVIADCLNDRRVVVMDVPSGMRSRRDSVDIPFYDETFGW